LPPLAAISAAPLSRENGRLEERAAHLEAEPGRARAERDAARAEAEETARLAEEAAGLRAPPPAAGRPWWRVWG
jgi:hypothetical protein